MVKICLFLEKHICWKTLPLYNMLRFINLPNKYQFQNKQMSTILKNHKLHFILHQNFTILQTNVLIAWAYKYLSFNLKPLQGVLVTI
jgi:hypothetical protein